MTRRASHGRTPLRILVVLRLRLFTHRQIPWFTSLGVSGKHDPIPSQTAEGHILPLKFHHGDLATSEPLLIALPGQRLLEPAFLRVKVLWFVVVIHMFQLSQFWIGICPRSHWALGPRSSAGAEARS